MKECPNCKMTLDTHNECPACGQDLTNEPYSNQQGERYAFNRFFLMLLIKHHKFATFCAVFVLVRLIAFFMQIDVYCIPASICAIICVLASFFKQRFIALISIIYSESYATFMMPIIKYVAGIGAIVLSIL